MWVGCIKNAHTIPVTVVVLLLYMVYLKFIREMVAEVLSRSKSVQQRGRAAFHIIAELHAVKKLQTSTCHDMT